MESFGHFMKPCSELCPFICLATQKGPFLRAEKEEGESEIWGSEGCQQHLLAPEKEECSYKNTFPTDVFVRPLRSYTARPNLCTSSLFFSPDTRENKKKRILLLFSSLVHHRFRLRPATKEKKDRKGGKTHYVLLRYNMYIEGGRLIISPPHPSLPRTAARNERDTTKVFSSFPRPISWLYFPASLGQRIWPQGLSCFCCCLVWAEFWNSPPSIPRIKKRGKMTNRFCLEQKGSCFFISFFISGTSFSSLKCSRSTDME